MATVKSYADIEQSKKLAEILPLESADMVYVQTVDLEGDEHYDIDFRNNQPLFEDDISAWSLSSLLDILDYPQLSKDKLGSGKEGWMVSVYPNDCRYDSCWHDNPVDACVAMIEKLHELKML